DLVLTIVEDMRQPLWRIHAHVVVGAGNDELVGFQVLIEDHLPRFGAFHPQVVGDLPLGREQPTDLGTDAVDPVHASRAPSTRHWAPPAAPAEISPSLSGAQRLR